MYAYCRRGMMAKYIPVSEAASMLNVSPTTLTTSKGKYRRFYRPAKEGKKDAAFDIDGYLKWEAMLDHYIKMAALLTEYLRHEKGIGYTELSRMLGVAKGSLEKAIFSLQSAIKITETLKRDYPDLWQDFHDYYDFRHPIDRSLHRIL